MGCKQSKVVPLGSNNRDCSSPPYSKETARVPPKHSRRRSRIPVLIRKFFLNSPRDDVSRELEMLSECTASLSHSSLTLDSVNSDRPCNLPGFYDDSTLPDEYRTSSIGFCTPDSSNKKARPKAAVGTRPKATIITKDPLEFSLPGSLQTCIVDPQNVDKTYICEVHQDPSLTSVDSDTSYSITIRAESIGELQDGFYEATIPIDDIFEAAEYSIPEPECNSKSRREKPITYQASLDFSLPGSLEVSTPFPVRQEPKTKKDAAKEEKDTQASIPDLIQETPADEQASTSKKIKGAVAKTASEPLKRKKRHKAARSKHLEKKNAKPSTNEERDEPVGATSSTHGNGENTSEPCSSTEITDVHSELMQRRERPRAAKGPRPLLQHIPVEFVDFSLPGAVMDSSSEEMTAAQSAQLAAFGDSISKRRREEDRCLKTWMEQQLDKENG